MRIICDTRLNTPLSARLVNTAREIPTIIATCCGEEEKQRPYLKKGCELIVLPEYKGHIDMKALMAELGKREIDSVLLEGGGTLNWSALEAGIVNKVYAYVAPKLFGGAAAKSPIGGQGFPAPDECVMLKNSKITVLEPDILIESEVGTCLQA